MSLLVSQIARELRDAQQPYAISNSILFLPLSFVDAFRVLLCLLTTEASFLGVSLITATRYFQETMHRVEWL